MRYRVEKLGKRSYDGISGEVGFVVVIIMIQVIEGRGYRFDRFEEKGCLYLLAV